jgi:hypothetical protein
MRIARLHRAGGTKRKIKSERSGPMTGRFDALSSGAQAA